MTIKIKIVSSIFAAAIIAFAAVNLNLAFKSEYTNFSLASLFSLANVEDSGANYASQPADKDCGLYYFPGYGWLKVSCQYDFCLTNSSGSCTPSNCCP